MARQYVSFDQAIDGEYGRENFERVVKEHPHWTNGQIIEYLEKEKKDEDSKPNNRM